LHIGNRNDGGTVKKPQKKKFLPKLLGKIVSVFNASVKYRLLRLLFFCPDTADDSGGNFLFGLQTKIDGTVRDYPEHLIQRLNEHVC
jgi:hypothetical protein